MKRQHTRNADTVRRNDSKRRDETRGAEAKAETIARRQARRNKRALCYGIA